MTKTIWILGGSGDIGRAIARRFGAEGWTVWLSARTPSRLQSAVDDLATDGIDARAVRADAARPEDIDHAVSELAETTDDLAMFVYNVSPQDLDERERLDAYLQHTVHGMAAAFDALQRETLTPSHVVVPTSSKARDPGAVSPEYHTAKQSLLAYIEAVGAFHDVAHTVLWLGRRGTEEDWRWLRPEEMAAKAWEAYETECSRKCRRPSLSPLSTSLLE